MLIARLFHNLCVCPLLGLVDLLSLGYYYPDWLDRFHDWTADLAFGVPDPFEERETARKNLPDGTVCVAAFWDGNDGDPTCTTHLQMPDNKVEATECLNNALGFICQNFDELSESLSDGTEGACEGCDCGC